MEKTFEEKFGLKTEEMEAILGGVVQQAVNEVSSCVACTSTCFFCTSCVGCQTKLGDVVPLE